MEADVALFRQLGAFPAFAAAFKQRFPKGSAVQASDEEEFFARYDAYEEGLARVDDEGLAHFLQSYLDGLGGGPADVAVQERFARGELVVYAQTPREWHVDAVVEGFTRLITRYALPLSITVRHPDERGARLIAQSCTPDGLFDDAGLPALAAVHPHFSAYVTEIRGGTGDSLRDDKNHEEFYGCSRHGAIVFTLGGRKDMSSETLAQVATHELIHAALVMTPHHEYDLPGRTGNPHFDENAPCVFYANDHRERRIAEPCDFLDYQLRLAARGTADRHKL